MCGIAGFLSTSSGRIDNPRKTIETLITAQMHRGPEGSNFWHENDFQIALCHNRLAILDLSTAANQPMISKNGRWVIAFNGEIYNYKNLTKHFSADISFRSTGDTEVLLEYFAQFGVQKTLEAISGMFAIALYDRQEGKLYLIRDGYGKKPLFYTNFQGAILFASEISTLLKAGVPRVINSAAMECYFARGYSSGECFIKGVMQVPPGHYAEIDSGGIHIKSHWEASRFFDTTRKLSYDEAIDGVEKLLVSSVEKRLMSDVPLGVFLSGGIDSTLILSLLAKKNVGIKTYTISFPHSEYDETDNAKKIANYFSCDHHTINMNDVDILDAFERLPLIYGEPFADLSSIASIILAKHAKQDVTVVLNGDGGDEVFGGYYRYSFFLKYWRSLSHVPEWVRDRAREVLDIPLGLGTFSRDIFGKSLLGEMRRSRLIKLRRLLGANNFSEAYFDAMRFGELPDYFGLSTPAHFAECNYNERDILKLMRKIDCGDFLPGDILVKTDRALMSHAVEGRSPFLDRELGEFVLGLPSDVLRRGGKAKSILRSLLKRHIDETYIAKRKIGFYSPILSWLRGPLKGVIDDLVHGFRSSILDNGAVSKLYKNFLDAPGQHYNEMWLVVVFLNWERYWTISNP